MTAHTQAAEMLHLMNNMGSHRDDFTKALHKLTERRQYTLEALLLEIDATMAKGLQHRDPTLAVRMKQLEIFADG